MKLVSSPIPRLRARGNACLAQQTPRDRGQPVGPALFLPVITLLWTTPMVAQNLLPLEKRAPATFEQLIDSGTGGRSTREAKPIKTITFGTRRSEVQAMLGRPTLESVIPSLRRVREVYEDGTEVTFVNNQAVSIVPGDRAQQAADGNFVVDAESMEVRVDSVLLPYCELALDHASAKAAVEEDFWFDVNVHSPSLYGDLHFTPPLVSGPYIRAYHLQFGWPHFFWPQPNGYDWCPHGRTWHFNPTPGAKPPLGSGYYSRTPGNPALR